MAKQTKAVVIKDNEPANNALTVLQAAINNPGLDIEKMEKFINLYEKMENKKSEQAYYEAFPKLQSELPEVSKDGKIIVNGEIRSNYAKFETIMKVIQPALTANGFGISFIPRIAEGKIIVSCKVSHTGGHIEKADIELPFDSSGTKNTVQSIGSSMTYAKRYALCLILNIPVGGEDNDGNKPPSLPIMNKNQFSKTLLKVASGGVDLKTIEENFTLDEKQREAFLKAIS